LAILRKRELKQMLSRRAEEKDLRAQSRTHNYTNVGKVRRNSGKPLKGEELRRTVARLLTAENTPTTLEEAE